MKLRNVALIASIKREETALSQEKKALGLAEGDCPSLPDKLRELEDRVFAFSLELSEAPECDVDILDLVAKLHISVRLALDSLKESTHACKGIAVRVFCIASSFVLTLSIWFSL